MKNKKTYQAIVLYTLIAIPVGIAVGAIDALFGRVLLAITAFRGEHVFVLVPFLALAGLLILFLYKKFSPDALKGMTLVYEVGFQERDHIPKALIPLIMVSTWITHLFGGSAGREGVAVQIGATLSHAVGTAIGKTKLGKLLGGADQADASGSYLRDNGRIFLLMGMAAGFGGLFQTPLAATFFAIEVLIAGHLFLEALIPALCAAYVSSFTSHLLGLEKFSVSFAEQMVFTPETIAKLIIVAIIFGVVGGAFAHFLGLAKKKFGEWLKQPYLRIFVMGIGLSVILLILWKGRYCGLGTNLISASFQGEPIYGYDFILKFVLTILTLAAGYQGGEVTPLFSIGATLGVFLASILGLPVLLIAALGYAAVFGSATNTLIAPILIGVEVFGPEHAIYFVIVCAIAYVCNGNKSIYGKQRIQSLASWMN